jgi:hypothetical protein
MAHTVVVLRKAAATYVDSYVRPVLAQQAMDNGYFFSLNGVSTAGSGVEAWIPVVPTTGSLSSLWMLKENEIPSISNGTNVYNGLGTIRDFYVSASQVATAVKPQVGDIIEVTAEAFVSGTAPTLGQHCVATNGTFLLTAQAAGGAGQDWVCREVTYLPFADGTIGSSRLVTYRLECIIA